MRGRALWYPFGPCGVVRLKDGALAFVSRRFDRLDDGRKLAQEDFCQLAGKSPKEKYEGSAELCVRLVGRYVTEPLVELLKLFSRLVFIWLSGNGDMHLKNFSLLKGPDGMHRLSPAYDLVCTNVVIPDDQLALPVGGKKDNLSRPDWLAFAEYCEIPKPAADRALGHVARSLEGALELIPRSPLSDAAKNMYTAVVTSRLGRLSV